MVLPLLFKTLLQLLDFYINMTKPLELTFGELGDVGHCHQSICFDIVISYFKAFCIKIDHQVYQHIYNSRSLDRFFLISYEVISKQIR